MTWRMAKSLEVLLKQINEISPNRSKESDGGIGNAEHSSRSSDHNPDDDGVVCARDFTNDPAHGIVSQKLAEALVASRDKRIKYVISNKRICSGEGQDHTAWQWRPYPVPPNKNPHDHHCHISVTKAGRDDVSPWHLDISPAPDVVAAPVIPAEPILKKGATGPDVGRLQALLRFHGVYDAEGTFGPITEAAAKVFQQKHGLVADGAVGKYTWDALKNV